MKNRLAKMLRSTFPLVVLFLAACSGGSTPPPASYTISATVTGLISGQTVTLLDNGGNSTAVTTTGTTTFSTALVSGTAYAVTVGTQPTGQACSVVNGAGIVGSANVNVRVNCPAPAKYAYVANYGANTVSQYTTARRAR